MKGLRKYLAPFATDQSGAVSVLFEEGGILVICDAGGCTGNICGFDEPRWFSQKSAVFSAGLRDMDAILGRDERLVAKLTDAASKINATFAAIIGTPVPSVIGTDYKALCRMAQQKLSIPVFAVETTGMQLYEMGEEKAYLALIQSVLTKKSCWKKVKGKVGVFGATPLATSYQNPEEVLIPALKKEGACEVFCYGITPYQSLEQQLMSVEKNIVISTSGLKAAKYLKQNYQIPFEVHIPYLTSLVAKELDQKFEFCNGKKVLILHQQVLANELRTLIHSFVTAKVTVGSWFSLLPEEQKEGDLRFDEEDAFIDYVKAQAFDVIFGDACYKKALRFFEGTFIPLTHYAVSGHLNEISEVVS